jgi:predicted TIM-barrel fold metal-dependent hydrolase
MAALTRSPNCPPPVEHPSTPTVTLPPHATDSHCHVFGPHSRFPYAEERTFTPADVPRERLRALHDHLGFERALIVQSACHGSDHSAMLDAMATSGGRYRGVALVTPRTDPGLVAEWAAAGVCGARLNFLPHLGGAPSQEAITAVVDLIRPHGWHLAVHVAGSGVTEYADVMTGIEVPVVIDHMARVDLAGGPEDVDSLLRLLDTGGVWVKLSGADRLSGGPVPSAAAIALARRLALHAPERVVWGTDFPHPNIAGAPPDDGALVDTLARVAPEPGLLERLLVGNPAQLFGWSRP